jgi:[pyruvate, water dikinase]-phosphate phosphotransferase / [pyruvate, water dikinase] kinase
MTRRTVYFVSDLTGITAEQLGNSLLAHFEGADIRAVTLPFIDSPEKARKVAEIIDRTAETDGRPPIVFSTLFIPDLRAIVKSANGLTLDLFDTFLEPLERGLGLKSVHSQKRPQDISESQAYNFRIRATDFALATDDGRGERLYSQADLILLGVSRSGKTPTCLYLALHYGIFAANYPLDEDDFESTALPKTIAPYRGKLYGVTISPERLRSIRLERRAAGRYASPQQVSFELRAAESLYSRYGIPFVDATHSSIEEIASTILSDTGLERHARTY